MPEHTILVVEDDEFQRRQIVRLLTADGYTVLQASAGDEAIRIIGEQSLNLVLTDRKMPGMDGDSVFRYVRTHHSHIPVVIVTAYPDGIESLEPDGLLVKPFMLDQLREQVRRLTERHDT